MSDSSVNDSASDSRILARCKVVDEHVQSENQHDLERVMRTFGEGARYDDEPYDEHHVGHDQVRAYYTQLLSAMPDLHIAVEKRHITEAAIVLEVIISGHHRGTWKGLPPTGRRIEFPLCAIYTFDESDRMAGERIYYDRASILRQLHVFHEPTQFLGRISIILMHPLTIARIFWRRLLGR